MWLLLFFDTYILASEYVSFFHFCCHIILTIRLVYVLSASWMDIGNKDLLCLKNNKWSILQHPSQTLAKSLRNIRNTKHTFATCVFSTSQHLLAAWKNGGSSACGVRRRERPGAACRQRTGGSGCGRSREAAVAVRPSRAGRRVPRLAGPAATRHDLQVTVRRDWKRAATCHA